MDHSELPTQSTTHLDLSQHYTPLASAHEQIRLLHLQPAVSLDETVRCHTTVVSLQDRTIDYEALSYVWGGSVDDHKISLNNKPLAVTTNLLDALIHLRSTNRQRLLWVDAICIDQSNQTERSKQVSHMHDIFAHASAVLIWLGPSNPDVQIAWQFFRTMGTGKESHLNEMGKILTIEPGIEYEIQQLKMSLKRFMAFEWWMRIWTVQEWVLAQSSRFYCGQDFIDGNLVLETAHKFQQHVRQCCRTLVSSSLADSIRYQTHEIISIRNYRVRLRKELSSKHLQLDHLVSRYRFRNATDPRDKIYGILSIAAADQKTLVEPNYDMTVQQVYESFALALIQRTRNLDILSYVMPRQCDPEVSSWVPDWVKPQGRSSSTTGQTARSRAQWCRMYRACGDYLVQYSVTNHHITVEGVILDTVAVVADLKGPEEETNFAAGHMLDLTEWKSLFEKDPFVQGQDNLTTEESFWLSLCGGMEWNAQGDVICRLYNIEDFSRFKTWWTWARLPRSEVPDRSVRLMNGFANIVSYQRTFMVGHDQVKGWVPETSRPGDVIAVVKGGHVPLVLRPHPEGYIFVGDAYIQGIMDGEAMQYGTKMEQITLI